MFIITIKTISYLCLFVDTLHGIYPIPAMIGVPSIIMSLVSIQ